ncbi:MAG: DeoR family transcriptional regulator [Proteobacteria bacterium]|nr:DeoR family transcriptional regulator [Pseudomonadota bacterium]
MERARFACEELLKHIKQSPVVMTIPLANQLGMSPPTVRKALESMVTLGILEEISGKNRDKVYMYRKYLDILEEGTEPLPFDNE